MSSDLAPLRDADLLQGLSDIQRNRLSDIGEDIKCPDGTFLFHMGDMADRVYVVRSGLMQLTVPLRVQGSEREVGVDHLPAGSALAWSALVEPHRLTVSARASGFAELVSFQRAPLLDLCAEDFELGYRIMANITAVARQRLQIVQTMWLRELQRVIDQNYSGIQQA
jgi:CRP-like cAMP-binding protein